MLGCHRLLLCDPGLRSGACGPCAVLVQWRSVQGLLWCAPRRSGVDKWDPRGIPPTSPYCMVPLSPPVLDDAIIVLRRVELPVASSVELPSPAVGVKSVDLIVDESAGVSGAGAGGGTSTVAAATRGAGAGASTTSDDADTDVPDLARTSPPPRPGPAVPLP